MTSLLRIGRPTNSGSLAEITAGERGVAEKRLVTCTHCGFRVVDEGDAGTPSLSGDGATFARTCRHSGELPPRGKARSFQCPELLAAARHAALAGESGRVR